MSETDRYSIARRMAFARPVRVGWSSNGNHPMSHRAPLTESQFLHLLHCGVIRTDREVIFRDDEAHVLTVERDKAVAERDQLLDLLRRIRSDRPSVHSDELWAEMNTVLMEMAEAGL